MGAYESRAEALAVVRNAIREVGIDVLATMALGCEDEDGNTVVIAAGRDLANLAVHEDPLHVPHAATS
jgi:hypothetical protein